MCTIGYDPELFIRNQAGDIVASREIIPADGWAVPTILARGDRPVIHRDGLQVELHGVPGYACRANHGHHLAELLMALQSRCQETNLAIDWSPVVQIDLAKMDPNDLILGCMPSENAYGLREMLVPAEYTIRSAGGHLHFGWKHNPDAVEALVKTLDMNLGIPSVILDRHPLGAERRRLYGRAGEYRLPKHGIEYRTMSNFWLRAYPLFSMLTAIGRGTINRFFGYGLKESIRTAALIPAQVEEVINRNDLDGAWELWNWWCQRQSPYPNGGCSSLTRYFTEFMKEGLEVFHPDPIENWKDAINAAHYTGGEAFLLNRYAHKVI